MLERLTTCTFIVVVAYVTWYLPQVTIQEGVALFGVVAIRYVVISHELLTRTTLPA